MKEAHINKPKQSAKQHSQNQIQKRSIEPIGEQKSDFESPQNKKLSEFQAMASSSPAQTKKQNIAQQINNSPRNTAQLALKSQLTNQLDDTENCNERNTKANSTKNEKLPHENSNIVQRRLEIAGNEIPDFRLTRKSAYKKRVHTILNEEADNNQVSRGMVKAELLWFARQGNHSFNTIRDAVRAAIMNVQTTLELNANQRAYDYVFIGAGAATAYYIEENLNALRGKRILVIGPEQPWASERGPGNINHPKHQVVPKQAPQANQPLIARVTFSQWVSSTLTQDELTIDRADARVTNRPQLMNRQYIIETDGDTPVVAAKNVILSAGIGPHKKPRGYDNIDENQKGLSGNNQALTFPRVMSLDEFQQAVGTNTMQTAMDLFDGRPRLVIVGPNAGIDAVTTYARQLMDISDLTWIAKTLDNIPFLEGTDNAKGKAAAQTLGANLVTSRFASVEISGPKVVAKLTGDAPDVIGDVLVYALGPEPDYLDQFLPQDEIAENLEPVYDQNNRINSAHDEKDSANELDDANLETRLGQWIREEKALTGRQLNYDKVYEMMGIFNSITEKQAPKQAPDFGRKVQNRPRDSLEVSVVGLSLPNTHKGGPSFQVIGGSAYRLASKVSYKHHSQSIARIIDATRCENTHDGKIISLKILDLVKKIESHAEQTFTLLTSRDDDDKEQGSGLVEPLRQLLDELLSLKIEFLALMAITEEGIAKSLVPIARYIDSLTSTINAFDAKTNSNNPFKASTHINEIASTLPINVALGDQLTSVLSQASVASEQQGPGLEERGVIGNEHVSSEEYRLAKGRYRDQQNLIINDTTSIAIFIASEYPDIPPVIANGMTRHIIWDRRYGDSASEAVPSYDLDADEASTTPQFELQEKWKEQLATLNRLAQEAFR